MGVLVHNKLLCDLFCNKRDQMKISFCVLNNIELNTVIKTGQENLK